MVFARRQLFWQLPNLLLLGLWGGASPVAAEPPAGPPEKIQTALRKQFDAHVADPAAYGRKVQRECAGFPEGDLFPYVMPAMAFANIAVYDPASAEAARASIAKLIELARPGVVKRLRPPNGRLEEITTYAGHGTYLGQFNLALGSYRLAGGDDRYDAMRKRISDVLFEALVRKTGRPLSSYPTLTWTFDTIPCLVSLYLDDLAAGTERSRGVTEKHLAWLAEHATDARLQLPFSRVNEETGRSLSPPRGCELSLRIALLAQIDALAARKLYESYAKSFWCDQELLKGFREWPPGQTGPADADSGPVVMGIGLTATGLGIAAAKANGDSAKLQVLATQVLTFKQVLSQLAKVRPSDPGLTMKGLIDPASDYVTGFLMGDASLFYSVTWCRWSKPGIESNSK